MNKTIVMAVDLGASSGRAMQGTVSDNTIELAEIRRWSNDPVTVNGTLYWDFLRLVYELKQSLLSMKDQPLQSLSVDTWGVDFGLLETDGSLSGNPVHYRDKRTAGMIAKAFTYIDRDKFYEITGNQFMELNTAFQLLSIIESDAEKTVKSLHTKKALLMPDLFNYVLTGRQASEYSIASTTQLLDAKKRNWSRPVMEKLGIPPGLFPDIIPSGTVVGNVTADICRELTLPAAPTVIAGCGHDTQCAIAAVPAREPDFLFLSCGTWSLIGTELAEPIITEKSESYNITNEGGYANRTSFLKNIIGLWLIQESRRQWEKEGLHYTFDELDQLADKAQPFRSFIDPDEPDFSSPGDIPERIRAYCRKTQQQIPQTTGEIVRCINESLAMKYRYAAQQIADCTGKHYEKLYLIGGGAKDPMLCQFTANALGKTVVAGPKEATVYGNILIQLITAGQIDGIAAARKRTAGLSEIKNYIPKEIDAWEKSYCRFEKLLNRPAENFPGV
jgi:rhamnulokinase/L-fuculokinase